ncbi:MAG: hypothetical protein JWQ57_1088, partial [Mucilaginibacter sp.]|nr:hypothetical protein [Mucilaginibacter sp.]
MPMLLNNIDIGYLYIISSFIIIYKPYNMKKKYTFLVFLLFIGISICKAQNYQPGYVILNDGTRVGGVVALNEAEPWYNQRYIRIKDSIA